jgi:ribosome-associated protein
MELRGGWVFVQRMLKAATVATMLLAPYGDCAIADQVETIEFARIARAACAEKKARDIRVIDVRGLTIVADYFLICTANSKTNARAIADEVQLKLKQEAGVRTLGVEGREEGWWILVDFGDVVVHIFEEEARQYYAIDETWADAPEIDKSEAA